MSVFNSYIRPYNTVCKQGPTGKAIKYIYNFHEIDIPININPMRTCITGGGYIDYSDMRNNHIYTIRFDYDWAHNDKNKTIETIRGYLYDDEVFLMSSLQRDYNHIQIDKKNPTHQPIHLLLLLLKTNNAIHINSVPKNKNRKYNYIIYYENLENDIFPKGDPEYYGSGMI